MGDPAEQTPGSAAKRRSATAERPPSPGTPVRNSESIIEHIQALRRYANALVGSHADADDLVQETLKRALVYVEADRQIDNLRAYLFTILHNVRKDALRKQVRSGTQVPVEDAPLISEAASASDRIACSQIIQAMQRLSEEHRHVLLLVGVEGLSYRETSEVLGLPIGTVMSRLSRARAALRDVLAIDGPVEVDRPL
jgi:RNA polymerase sigma-70 factor (ECF subfamily)